MSVLGTISKPEPRAPIVTIIGDAGTGKSSLAATFPNPVFIRAEDGLNRIDKRIAAPDAFPVITDAAQVWDQLIALLNEEHSYDTLVIDSVTKLEELFVREILERDTRAKGINQALGGYGNGPAAVAAQHARIRKAAAALNTRKGMAVIFIGHADLETMRLPDSDDYQRYSLRLMPKSIAPYVDDVDLVALVRLTSALRGDEGERKKVVSDGSREIVCHATAASVTKNGLGITGPLDFEPGGNPLLAAMAPASKEPAKMQPNAEEQGQ